ncbi:MAG: lipopolysaccharide heptosyltransferase II [Chloroflexi bacterium]|nr:lipopolysaccharide heptosyltransferase II [Chloroflexota bacterium]
MSGIRHLLLAILNRLFRSQSRPPPAQPRAVVVVKPCCLGDVLMATAAIRQIRRSYPEARLALAVGDWSRPAVAGNPDVDEIVPAGRVGTTRPGRWRDYLRLVWRLRRGRYDAAVVLDRSAWLALLPWMAGIPHRAGINSGGRGFALTVRASWQPDRHEADLSLDVLRAMGLAVAPPRLRFVPGAEDLAWAGAALAEIGSERVVTMHPGGGANPGMVLTAKRWLPDRFAAVGARLVAGGAWLVLVGAPSDRSAADAVLAHLPAAARARTVDLVGQTTFGRLGAVLARSALHIGNDAGPTHLAAAVGAPVIAIFGPSSPAMYRPIGDHAIALYRQVPCSPCFVNGSFDRSCRDYRCIRAVTVEDVLDAAARFRPEGSS